MLNSFSLLVVVDGCSSRWPTVAEAKAELLSSGLSTQAVDGIMRIVLESASPVTTSNAIMGNNQAIRSIFNLFISRVDAYIKTQSQEDQDAFNAFIVKKKADLEAHIASRS